MNKKAARIKTVATQKGGKDVPVPRRIYVRKRLDAWSSLKIPVWKIGGDVELPLSGEGIESCGFLIAYPTRKLFRKHYPREIPLVFSVVATSVPHASNSDGASGKPK